MKFREATIEDAKLLFDWASDADVRANAFLGDPIELDRHVKWLAEKLRSPRSIILMLYYKEELPVGQIRYDLNNEGQAEVDISIGCEYRGRSYARMGLKATQKYIFDRLNTTKIIAYVKKDNVASRKSFQKAGFREEGLVVITGGKVYRLAIDKDAFHEDKK